MLRGGKAFLIISFLKVRRLMKVLISLVVFEAGSQLETHLGWAKKNISVLKKIFNFP
jgi:hypothetical protein